MNRRLEFAIAAATLAVLLAPTFVSAEVSRVEITARHLGVIRIGKRGIEMGATRPPALVHRAREIVLRPASDAGQIIGRDVRRHDRAERRLQREPAGKGLPAAHGMTGDAIAGGRQRLAALDRDVVVGIGRGATYREQRQQHEKMAQPHDAFHPHGCTSGPDDFR